MAAFACQIQHFLFKQLWKGKLGYLIHCPPLGLKMEGNPLQPQDTDIILFTVEVFFNVILRKISYYSTCAGNFPPPTINVSWRQLILETRRKFEISTTLKSLFLFRYFSSVRNNTPVLIASHFASHWLSSFTNLIMPNAATAQPTMMINCLNHSFRVCPLKYSPVQTGNKISQETSTGNIWHLLKNEWRFQTQPVLLSCFKKHIIISN